jgi:hypothetical protein
MLISHLVFMMPLDGFARCFELFGALFWRPGGRAASAMEVRSGVMQSEGRDPQCNATRVRHPGNPITVGRTGSGGGLQE